MSRIGDFNAFVETYSDDRFVNLEGIDTGPKWDYLIQYHRFHHQQNVVAGIRLRKILKLIPKKENITILDIGFGYGDLLQAMETTQPFNNAIIGVDISQRAIQECRNRVSRCLFLLGDVANLPLKTNSMDVILLNEVLEHVPVSRVFQVYEELKRVLKQEGRLIVSVPIGEELETTTFQCPHGTLVNQNGHVRTYTREVLEMELHQVGIEAARVEAIFPPVGITQKICQFLQRIARKLRGRSVLREPSNLIVLGRRKKDESHEAVP